MLNVKYWRIFCDVISLLAQIFIVPFDRAYKEVSAKKYFSIAQFLIYDCTFKKQSTVPGECDLDLWPMKVKFFQWIDNEPVSVLYDRSISLLIAEK